MERNANNEALLLERARRGDSEAFSALVELHQERAIRAAWSVIGNAEDARDAAQDAFIKAYERLAQFDGRSGFYTWFYRILLNTCKDFLRKKKIRRTFSFWFSNDEEDEAAFDPPDTARGAREEAEAGELGAATFQALERLPERQRMVFTLRYLEGLELKAIAEALMISEGAVKAHLWHAAQKMREWLLPYRSKEALQ